MSRTNRKRSKSQRRENEMTLSRSDIDSKIRKSWGSCKPVQIAHSSKKDERKEGKQICREY